MKKDTILLLALVLGIGGYRYWQEQQKKKQAIEPKKTLLDILKAIEQETEDSSTAIKKVSEVFKIELNDANKTWELYQQNRQVNAEQFDQILKQNGLME